MTVTLELTPEMEKRLRDAAAERGQGAAELLMEMLNAVIEQASLLPDPRQKPLTQMVEIPFYLGPRIAGLNKGEIQMSEDFDAPLPDSFWVGSGPV